MNQNSNTESIEEIITSKLLSLDILTQKYQFNVDFNYIHRPAETIYNYILKNKDKFKLIQEKGKQLFTGCVYDISFNEGLQELTIKKKLNKMSSYRNYTIRKMKGHVRYKIKHITNNTITHIFPRSNK